MAKGKSVVKPVTVAFMSSEAAPYSKTGGLADVAGALCRALARLGHDVHLFVPLYRCVDRKKIKLPKKGTPVKVPISARIAEGKIHTVEEESGLSVHFVEHDGYFDRDHLYNTPGGDYADNAERFIFFSRACLEGLSAMKIRPDIIHANDWQTGLVPPYLKTVYKDDPFLTDGVSVMTIHNLGFQGHFWHLDWHLTGLDWSLYGSGQLEFYDKINFLKGGIVFADVITTVSRTYADEIKTKDGGWGLDHVLRERADQLYGIVNGIDTDEWNPATDRLIPANYTSASIAGKKTCKRELLKEMGLPPGDEPVIGVVSRLAEQKGFDLLCQVIDRILDHDVKFVLLGSGGQWFQNLFTDLAMRRPDRAAVRIGYDEGLAHRIEAGADIFLMPSHYEPCGLNQLYSLRYGTVPVVRATGGLNDTVENYDAMTERGNGFKFHDRSADALFNKVMEAVSFYIKQPAEWMKLMKKGMKEDHSWDSAARLYEKLYRRAMVADKR